MVNKIKRMRGKVEAQIYVVVIRQGKHNHAMAAKPSVASDPIRGNQIHSGSPRQDMGLAARSI